MGTRSWQSIAFGGTNEYASAGDVHDFDYNVPFSIGCWLRSSATGGYFMSKITIGGLGWGIAWEAAGRILFILSNQFISDEDRIRTDDSFNDGTWHHVVATSAGTGVGGMKVYVDGVLQAVTTVYSTLGISTTVGTAPLNIAGRSDGGAVLVGSLDFAFIYDVEVNAEFVSYLYNGGDPADPRLLFSKQYGPLTKSVLLDGVNEYVDFTNFAAVDFDSSDPFSAAIWFKTTATDGSMLAKMVPDSSTTGWRIQVDGSGRLRFDARQATAPMEKHTTFTVNDGGWHHALVTYDGSQTNAGITLYLDGVLQTAVSASGNNASTMTNSGPLLAGESGSFGFPNRPFDGNLCHGSVWGSELTVAHVSEVFGNGRPQDLNSLATAPAPAWWSALGDGDAIGASNVLDLSGAGNHGTTVNMESGDFVTDAPAEVGSTFGKGDPNLVAFWPMDIVTYPDIWNTVANGVAQQLNPITDFSREGNNLPVGGGFDIGDVGTGPGGISSRSFNPDGGGFERFTLAHGSLSPKLQDLFKVGRPFSVSYWYRSTAAASGAVMSKLDSPQDAGWYTGASATGGTCFLILVGGTGAGNRTYVRSSSDVNDSTWHHLCFTKGTGEAGSDITVWVDGVDESTIVDDNFPAGADYYNDAVPFQISGYDGTNAILTINQEVAELVLFDYVLSGSEVAGLRDGGVPGNIDALGNRGIVGYWRPGEGFNDLTMANMESSDVRSPDAPGGIYGCEVDLGPYGCADVDRSAGDGCLTTLGAGDGVQYYKMRGQDDGVPAPGYVQWVSKGPDYAGANAGSASPPLVGSLIPGKTIVVGRFFIGS